MGSKWTVEPIVDADRGWVKALLVEHWGGPEIVTRGVLYQAHELAGYIARVDADRAGLLTYHCDGTEWQIVSLNGLVLGAGVRLVERVKEQAKRSGCTRLWLITTNDNTSAMRFYQHVGFGFRAVYPNALEQSRRLKPSIPLVGLGGIALRDEVELDLIP